jgi:hypothetical protein
LGTSKLLASPGVSDWIITPNHPRHVTRLGQLRHDRLGQVDGDREADADGAADLAEDGRVHLDGLAPPIDRRSPTVTGVDRGIGLDEAVVRCLTDHAARGARLESIDASSVVALRESRMNRG